MNIASFVWLIPRNLVIALIQGYRLTISKLYGDVCRYYPTCSAYGLGQVQQRGVILGLALAIARIARCNPWAKGGVDEVKPGSQRFAIARGGFVVPKVKKG